ncbi:S8 family serine peptidase [Aspergillus homomorphus CBS 101889]|uniref:Putative subtilisin n=1 Tax=Aspergillus homomorphus (strain CBS 101889) TaxID=1450537 RepID=A0A395HZ20_ASPHC|nr:putative subtilisin [Aspergillus homomorphus CBS 101889]RAL12937.1 putative subtilisin [Aspergillus homomorphus CBS 101889]
MATTYINGKPLEPTALQSQCDASESNYILIETKERPLEGVEKKELQKMGAHIHEFVGDETRNIYLCGYEPEDLARIRELGFVKYTSIYGQELVIQPEAQSQYPPKRKAKRPVDVMLHHDVVLSDSLIQQIADAANIDMSAIERHQGKVRLDVTQGGLSKLAAIDAVRSIKQIYSAQLMNNIARGIMNANNVTVNGTICKGEGQIVAVADTGFDNGSITDVHHAFEGRFIKLYALGRENVPDDPDGHGTHVCGSVLGSGHSNIEGKVEGVAPGADLIVQSVLADDKSLRGIPADLNSLFDTPYKDGARVHTNSWVSGPRPGSSETQLPYTQDSEEIDSFVWNHQDMAILFAAGNTGTDSDRSGEVDCGSIGAEAAAKNCITVGASENRRPNIKYRGQSSRFSYTYGDFWPNDFPVGAIADDHMANDPNNLAAFSSRGPTVEGRRKPDVVAPGTAILSTRSRKLSDTGIRAEFGLSGDTRFMYSAGTSMACPLVAGSCAVLRESLTESGYHDKQNGVVQPTGALLKALLVNGAVSIDGEHLPPRTNGSPNNHSGFGRVDLARSITPLDKPELGNFGVGVMRDEDSSPMHLKDICPPFEPGPDTPSFTLKVTLAYSDFAGAKLQNNLNLVASIGNSERHGNQGPKDYGKDSHNGFDPTNNVEQIVWENVTDNITICIRRNRLTTSEQPFAYVWRLVPIKSPVVVASPTAMSKEVQEL